MDSQTEQLDSMLPETRQLLEETQQQEAQPDQPDQPQPDLSDNEAPSDEDSENVIKADEADSETTIEEGQGEPETSEEVEPQALAEPEPEESIVVEAVEYGNLQDVATALDSMSPEIRAHVEPVLQGRRREV